MDNITLETTTNIETTIIPLLSICNLTSEFRIGGDDSKKHRKFKHYDLLNIQSIQLSSKINPQLVKIINDCQECFEKEANILLQNQMSDEHIDELFERYSQFAVECCYKRSEIFIPSNLSNTQNSIASSCTECDTFDTLASESTLSFDINDFDFEFTSLSTSSDPIITSPTSLDFNHLQLSNGSDTPYINHLQDEVDIPNIEPFGRKSSNETFFQDISFNYTPTNDNTLLENGRRKVSKEKKQILEAAYLAKTCPNVTERNFIAKKCNMSPSQVRIWFRNKRARCKGRV